MSISLYLSDILKRNNLNDLKRIKLIRHSLKHKNFLICSQAGFLREYTQLQDTGFSNGYDYFIVFISGAGTSAKLEGCYKVKGERTAYKEFIPEGFPIPDMFDNNNAYINLERIDILSDLCDRLIIDWGKSTISWHQKATNEKAVLSIQANRKLEFPGYEQICLPFLDLQTIINDDILYENWHNALKSIYAIYLITDLKNGMQYIGSAYNNDGLLGRWQIYIETKHGNNIKMIEIIKREPEQYKYFQFSILQILPKTLTTDEVIALENLYKKKLKTIEFGMNMQ